MNKILLIGCGHMGSALLNAWHNKTSNYFSVVDPNKYAILRRAYKRRVSVFKSIDKIQNTQQFDIIIFAVKPQIATKVMRKFIGLKYIKKFYLLVLSQEKKYLSLIIFYQAIINLYVSCLICLLWLKKGYLV